MTGWSDIWIRLVWILSVCSQEIVSIKNTAGEYQHPASENLLKKPTKSADYFLWSDSDTLLICAHVNTLSSQTKPIWCNMGITRWRGQCPRRPIRSKQCSSYFQIRWLFKGTLVIIHECPKKNIDVVLLRVVFPRNDRTYFWMHTQPDQ